MRKSDEVTQRSRNQESIRESKSLQTIEPVMKPGSKLIELPKTYLYQIK